VTDATTMIHRRPQRTSPTNELFAAATEDERTIIIRVSPAQLRLLKRVVAQTTYKASEAARVTALLAILKDL